MEHDLQRLGPYSFQQMSAALALAALGAHVEVLGPGRDGGRDLYCRGRLSFQLGTENVVWDGYTVFQVKQKEQLAARPEANAAWLWTQIRDELEAWANHATGREEVPNNLLFITNVPLTPTPDSGGHATIRRNIQRWMDELTIDNWDVDESSSQRRLARKRRMSRVHWAAWDGNQLDTLLTVHQGVRRQFNAFLTPGDILANIHSITDRVPPQQLATTLRTHARTTLTGDAFIYFDEAGAAGGAATPLEWVVIDLPITGGRRALAYTLGRGDRVLSPGTAIENGPRHLVLAGAPGNGKTTLSKFLVQAYRAAFLDGDEGLSEGQRQVLLNTFAALSRMKVGRPQHRRWPLRIDLAEYAEHALDEDSTLQRWIASRVTNRINDGAVSPATMQWWMGQWPWLLVLDGLDEVTTPDARKRLIRQIVEFVEEADADQRDLLVLLTTRPVGYVEEIAPHLFERIDLAELDGAQAVAYGMQATRVRLGGDDEKIQRVERELQRAAKDEALRLLMRTPLQVLIMTIIVESAGSLPPDRYSLFWGYYDTVRRRELAKPGPTRKLLESHGPVILELHQRVGFALQAASELVRNSTAVLSQEELRRITREVLIGEGWAPTEIDSRWLDEIEQAVTQRLVLLAPRGADGYGFDVRSLQELMAARHLVTGKEDEVHRRLAIAAAAPHWRNTWVFAAGAIFADRQRHEQEALIRLIRQVDHADTSRLSSAFPVAADLALDLIDDGMSRNRPTSHRALLEIALGALSRPCSHDHRNIARILIREADQSDENHSRFANSLRNSLGSDALSRQIVNKVMGNMPGAFDDLGVRGWTRSLAAVVPFKAPVEGDDPTAWHDLITNIQELANGDIDSEKLAEFIKNLQIPMPEDDLRDMQIWGMRIFRSLRDSPSWAAACDVALEAVGPRLPDLMVVLHVVVSEIHRRPIGDLEAYSE